MPIIAIVLLVAAVVLGLMAYTRTLDHDVAQWHVDPLVAPKPSTPNSYRIGPEETVEFDAIAPVFDVPASELGATFDDVATQDDSVEIVAGSAEDGWVTYVQRSALFAFPDYISVRFIDVEGDRSTLAVFSRSRIGRSDLGVNKKRVIDWMSEVESALS